MNNNNRPCIKLSQLAGRYDLISTVIMNMDGHVNSVWEEEKRIKKYYTTNLRVLSVTYRHVNLVRVARNSAALPPRGEPEFKCISCIQ